MGAATGMETSAAATTSTAKPAPATTTITATAKATPTPAKNRFSPKNTLTSITSKILPLLRRSGSSNGSGTGTIILNKYQLGRLLGRGTFAKVYQGIHIENTAAPKVAVKSIEKNMNFNVPLEDLIFREVSAMRRLSHHPGILEIHEILATKTKIYLVMELAPGGELFSRLQQRGRFSESTARAYFYQLVSALSFCHQHGIAHRDIKPQNLLLDSDGNLKISDFGLSALPETLKDGLLHTTCGTPAYTAPEVVYRKAYDGTKADAWSCGILLYHFLVGSLPYDDSDLIKMHRAIAKRRYHFPSYVSKTAKGIIYRLLDPNPRTRMSVEALMAMNWIKKAKVDAKTSEMGFTALFGDEDSAYQRKMNAFDIISKAPSLNLSGMFQDKKRKELRFATEAQAVEIEATVERAGGELGFKMERGKAGGIGLVRGCALLRVEIWEMVAGLSMVELKVVDGRRVFHLENSHWLKIKEGLKEIAVSWPDEDEDEDEEVQVEVEVVISGEVAAAEVVTAAEVEVVTEVVTAAAPPVEE